MASSATAIATKRPAPCTASCACAPSLRTTAISSARRIRSRPRSPRSIGWRFAVYKDFGFEDISLRLALRPEKRIGSDEVWDRAEGALRAALKACGVHWTELPGDGAFYGPKIDYNFKDSLGRTWTCGTMQVDFQMPERLGAEYVAEDNTRKVPVMLHRAIVGSLERFIGILIEHYAGALPLWLSPVQVVVLTITDRQAAYAEEVAATLPEPRFPGRQRFAQREDNL